MNTHTESWTQESLERLILDEVEESLTLDYKAAAALDKGDSKKREITKDVSAMANSAGGTIIYGIKEFDDPAKRHKPERLDPVLRSEFSKETIDNIISNIRPRILDIRIHVVNMRDDAERCVYVVAIPQGATAHQALDHRYYRRFNFKSEPMHDHEIRDVMGRAAYPRIELGAEIESWLLKATPHDERNLPMMMSGGIRERDRRVVCLTLRVDNVGEIYANYVAARVSIPVGLVVESERGLGADSVMLMLRNTRRDVVDYRGSGLSGGSVVYGPTRFEPILPRLSHVFDREIYLVENFESVVTREDIVHWTVHADNAPPISGELLLCDLHVGSRED